jgi:hypothetical protein
MKIKNLLILGLLAYCLPNFSTFASAQTGLAQEALSGRVLMDNGKPDRGIQIWIHEAKTGKGLTVQQDSSGRFTISLPEGYYFVFIANLGFVPYAREIWLRRGKPMKLIVKLEPDWANMQDVP